MRAFLTSAACCALLAAATAPVSAATTSIMGFYAFGKDLAGGTVTVDFSSGESMSAPILEGTDNEGVAGLPGYFSFEVVGETFEEIWSLTNLAASDSIVRANIDLNGSLSLFDDGSKFSKKTVGTTNSSIGRKGVTLTTGPAIVLAREYEPWDDPTNEGDMYLQEEILWESETFTAGQTFTWRDDTDLIPEPSRALLFVIASLAVCLRRRRGTITG